MGEYIIRRVPLVKHIYSAAKQARQREGMAAVVAVCGCAARVVCREAGRGMGERASPNGCH